MVDDTGKTEAMEVEEVLESKRIKGTYHKSFLQDIIIWYLLLYTAIQWSSEMIIKLWIWISCKWNWSAFKLTSYENIWKIVCFS